MNEHHRDSAAGFFIIQVYAVGSDFGHIHRLSFHGFFSSIYHEEGMNFHHHGSECFPNAFPFTRAREKGKRRGNGQKKIDSEENRKSIE
jgi:hypothetical protein